MKARPPMRIGISAGDPNGIGLEVALKALSNKDTCANCSPIIYASKDVIDQHLALLDLDLPEFIEFETGNDVTAGQMYFKEIWPEEFQVEPGVPTTASGRSSFESLQSVTDDLLEGRLEAMVTCPIDKKNIQNDAFQFPGHTEYLASKTDSDEVLMLLVSNGLRVGVVTGHIPLSEIAFNLTSDLISTKARLIHRTLIQDFGIQNPQIALLGLNPHAGDGGLLGSEEETIIAPSIAELRSEGIEASGPFPADGFFGSSNYKDYDAILAMYHDQGLIPFKALSFGSGVNFTAGLSIIRTSPDHGTAFGIAGQNKADGSSFAAALRSAVDIALNRRSISA